MKRIDSYVLKLMGWPLLLVLGVAAMLLLLERMLRLFDLVVNQGGPFSIVWQMLLNLVPHYMGLALPVALFLGILIAFRGLSSSSELDVLQANGVGLSRLAVPVFTVTALVVILNLILVGYLQPYGRYTYRSLRFDLTSGALGASVQEGIYTEIADGFTLLVQDISEGGERLDGILVYTDDAEGNLVVLSAESGSFRLVGRERDIVLNVTNGVQLARRPGEEERSILRFDSHDVLFELDNVEEFRDRGDGERELTFPELLTARQSGFDSTVTGEPVRPEVIAAELNARIVRSISNLVLPLIAIPLAIVRRRSDSSFGIAVGVVILLVYHKGLEFGEAMASAGTLPVSVGIWLPFVALAILGAYMFRSAAWHIEGGPLPWLADRWDDLLALIRRLLSGHREEDAAPLADQSAAE